MHSIADAAKKDMRRLVLKLDFRSKSCEKDVCVIKFKDVLKLIENNAKTALPGMCGQHVHHLFN